MKPALINTSNDSSIPEIVKNKMIRGPEKLFNADPWILKVSLGIILVKVIPMAIGTKIIDRWKVCAIHTDARINDKENVK